MDDTNDLKQGLKKFGKNDLNEVRADAKFNYLSRLREQREKEAYAAARAEGYEAVEELTKKTIAEFQTPKKGKK